MRVLDTLEQPQQQAPALDGSLSFQSLQDRPKRRRNQRTRLCCDCDQWVTNYDQKGPNKRCYACAAAIAAQVVPSCPKCGVPLNVFSSSGRIASRCGNCQPESPPRNCIDCGEPMPLPSGSGRLASRCVNCNPCYRKKKRKAVANSELSATCEVCGKDRRRFKNGNLKKCCRVNEYVPKTIDADCTQCGSRFRKLSDSPKKVCSSACGYKASREVQRQRGIQKREFRACAHCNSLFLGNSSTQVFCGPGCAARSRAEKEKPRRLKKRERVCNGCGLVFHHIEPNRKGIFCSRECSLANKSKWATAVPMSPDSSAPIVIKSDCKKTRRERLALQKVDKVDKKRVFERDYYKCQICLGPCKREWILGDPASPTLDHVIPLAKGGAHSYANCRTAHAICNSMKSDAT